MFTYSSASCKLVNPSFRIKCVQRLRMILACTNYKFDICCYLPDFVCFSIMSVTVCLICVILFSCKWYSEWFLICPNCLRENPCGPLFSHVMLAQFMSDTTLSCAQLAIVHTVITFLKNEMESKFTVNKKKMFSKQPKI